MTDTITIADLATELDTTVPDIARRVSILCHQLGARQVVHTAAASRGASVLHGSAADLIRLALPLTPAAR